MEIIEDIAKMQAKAEELIIEKATRGFVPTMGALHEGHLSLARRSVEENGVTIMSVFVNPAQFMPGEDYDSYPRTWDEDLHLAAEVGVDIVFHPTAGQMYPPRRQTTVQVHELTKNLCGMSRGLGHFIGVTTVVAKLLNIVRPTTAYFGQKDAQQALVIQRMVIDLNFPVKISVCPIVREDDGLALSSRNRNIPADLRPRALALREGLSLGREMIRNRVYDAQSLFNAMCVHILRDDAIELDYLHIVSPETLDDVDKVDDIVLIAGAIKIGGVRLIDNILVGPGGPWED